MTLAQVWDFFSYQKKVEILVACGVNNTRFLCSYCNDYKKTPYCDHDSHGYCSPSTPDHIQFRLNDDGDYIQTEPHAMLLADEPIDALPEQLINKIKELLNEI